MKKSGLVSSGRERKCANEAASEGIHPLLGFFLVIVFLFGIKGFMESLSGVISD